ncbi:hypothetical protein ABW20_dc0107120 [Dactylellina cionopaga]|nr:hypothetical protein ABW20_dc0107120 [Dactylellina cionopaga]
MALIALTIGIAIFLAYMFLIPWSWLAREFQKSRDLWFIIETRFLKLKSKSPVSVNYHFTRRCNYSCGFCFHTAKTSYMLSLENAKRGLKLLKDDGMRKLNFAGGEPFLEKEFLGQLIRYCKEELQLESISVVTNGSLVSNHFLKIYGKYLDIIAVSCDSFHESTNLEIGRGKGSHLKAVKNVAELCE